jgi:secreted PhoX family phosphatase
MIEYEGDKNKVYSSAGKGDVFGEIMSRRLSRRQALQTGIGASALVFGAASLNSVAAQSAMPVTGTAPTFAAIPQSEAADPTVASGYKVTPFLRWGDPLFADAPAFDILHQTAESPAKQVGYNCDFVGFIPLPAGSNASDHGLLVVNHEYTNPEIMFAGYLVPNPDLNGGTPVCDSDVHGEGGTFDEQISNWPDGMGAPRPTVVLIEAENGSPIGA